MKCCAAIIVAAGSSRRAGFDKLLAPLHGVKVLERSIRLCQLPGNHGNRSRLPGRTFSCH